MQGKMKKAQLLMNFGNIMHAFILKTGIVKYNETECI